MSRRTAAQGAASCRWAAQPLASGVAAGASQLARWSQAAPWSLRRSGATVERNAASRMPLLPPCAPALVLLSLLALAPCDAQPARATSLEDLRQLENLINASGTETLVAEDCPRDHAGYYESDGQTIDRLVICRRQVDMGNVQAVWQVMAHEATHIMQSCSGSTAIPNAQMPRTYRELQTRAPEYARLIHSAYSRAEQRLESEAFWMELQSPALVLELFRRNCAAYLQGASPPRRQPLRLPPSPQRP